MHSKYATGILPFTPDNNPYPGGVLQIDEASAGGVGPELNKVTMPFNGTVRLMQMAIHSHSAAITSEQCQNFVQTGSLLQWYIHSKGGSNFLIGCRIPI